MNHVAPNLCRNVGLLWAGTSQLIVAEEASALFSLSDFFCKISRGDNALNEDDVNYFAVQTALLSVVVQALVDNGTLDRDDITHRLYDLNAEFIRTGGREHHAGAIRHLISLIEDV